jgi:hypothetical protein
VSLRGDVRGVVSEFFVATLLKGFYLARSNKTMHTQHRTTSAAKISSFIGCMNVYDPLAALAFIIVQGHIRRSLEVGYLGLGF